MTDPAGPGRQRRSDVLLIAGLVASLIAIGLGPTIPALIRGASLALLVIGLVLTACQQRDRIPVTWWPIIVITVGVLPGLLNSMSFPQSLDTLHFLPIGFAVYLGVQLINPGSRRAIAIASLAVIAIVSIDGTVQFLFQTGVLSGRELAGNRVRSSMPHPNDIAIIPMLLPLALLSLKQWDRRTVAIFAAILVPLLVITVVTSWSRNTWLGMAIVAAALVIWRGGLVRLAVIAAVVMVVGLVAIDVVGIQDRLLSLAKPMNDGRIGLWLAAEEMFLRHPLTGIGPGLFGQVYPDVITAIDLPEGYRPEIGVIPWVHNVYLELLAEYGIPGFAAYAIVTAWAVAGLVIRLRQTDGSSGANDDRARDWAAALVL